MDNKQETYLAKLVGLQIGGFVVFEAIFYALFMLGFIPPYLTILVENEYVVQLHVAYILIVGLMAVLISGFWLAILLECCEAFEFKYVRLDLWRKKMPHAPKRRHK